MQLITNRYDAITPSSMTENGTVISTPFYVNPTTDKKNEILNAFRAIRAQQLVEMGHNEAPRKEGTISVHTHLKAPQTPIELELGTTEENLRLMVFSRQGIQEKLVIKLQEQTGVQIFTKEEAQSVFALWLEALFPNENNTAKTTTKKTTTRAKKQPA